MTARSTRIAEARTEVRRCQRALDSGSPPYFWWKRLDKAARDLEAAAAILRMQQCAVERMPSWQSKPEECWCAITHCAGHQEKR